MFRSSARPAREPRGAKPRPAAVSATPHEPEHDHEPEDLVSTGDLPLLEPESDGEPFEEPADEREAADSYTDVPESPEKPEGTELDELAREVTEYEEEEAEAEEREARGDARDSYPPPEPVEEPYHEPTPEPAEQAREAVSEEGPAEDDGSLPAFYRPRQRPIPKAPEPAKED